MEVLYEVIILAVLLSVACCSRFQHPLLRNITKMERDVDYLRTNFDQLGQSHSEIIQWQQSANETLVGIVQSQSQMIQSQRRDDTVPGEGD